MDGSIRTIVFGIGELDREDPHLGSAADLAARLGATLHVVHAFQLPDPAMYPYPEMSVFSPRAIDEMATGAQKRVEERTRAISGGAEVLSRALPGPADRAVLDVAGEVDADLILVGATRRSRVGRAVLGTTAQRIVRSATIPVLVMRSPEAAAYRRVLLTTDLSDLSARAHEHGTRLVTALAAKHDEPELRTLLVVNYDMPLPPPLGESAVDEVAHSKLDAFLKRVAPTTVAENRAIRVGDPAEEITAEAGEWNADLIVLGTHGRTGASRFLIGSVAESALKNAPCDVLVIPNPGRSPE
ncbi:MAG: universal stress protein [Gemmatimonadota bacterium]